MDIKQLFKKDSKTNSITFLGDKLEVLIPKRYEMFGCLTIQDEVMTMGIFEMIVNGKERRGYFLPARIVMVPSGVENYIENDVAYAKLTFEKGDHFIKHTEVVKSSMLAYTIFYEFVYLGNMPSFIDYDMSGFMFNVVAEATGTTFRTNMVIFEIMMSHLYRDKKKVTTPYRNTAMKDDPLYIPLRSAAHASTSTTGRVIGSFFNDGVNASLVNQSDTRSEIEDILRQ